MYLRHMSTLLQRFSTLYPLLGITGPRQSGKTTLVKQLFGHLPYISLENLDIRLQARQDPRAFLAEYSKGAILDEVQNVPELLSYLQGVVDSASAKGRYVLTGSQNFALTHTIAQSLPGRIGMSTLLPLSLFELGILRSEESAKESIKPKIDRGQIFSALFKGGYPGLHQHHMLPIEFYPSYIQTYIERDILQLKNVSNYDLFQNFVKLCVGRIGQVVNFSSLAADCGISHTTAREWLTLLKASYIVFFLQPFYKNFNKRVIKMPKIYFYDTGLACTLLGLEKEIQLQTHYLNGALFENLVIVEILKKRLNQGLPPNLYFWRDQTGHEVDLLADWGGQVHAIEIKLGSTFQSEFIKNVQYFCKLSETAKGYLIYTGEQTGAYAGIQLLPMQQILDLT